MSLNELSDLKVLHTINEPLTSENEDTSQMDYNESSSQRKRSSSGEGMNFSPPVIKCRSKGTPPASIRQSVLSSLRGIVSDLQATCLDRDNKITKQAAEKVLDHVGAIQDLILNFLTEHERLQGKFDRQLKLMAQKPQPQVPASFAEVTKRGIQRHNKTDGSHKTQKVMFVRPEDPGGIKDSDELKAKFMKSIDPRKDRIRFRQIRKLRNKSLLLEVENDDDIEKILRNKKLRESGLKAEQQSKRNPKVIMYDVPRQLEEKDLLEALRIQNQEVFSPADGANDCKLLFKTGRIRDDQVHWVMEVTPRIRGKLLIQGRLFVDFSSCKVKDYIGISRCFKCQSFGHVAKFCREQEDICSHCSESGHRYKECTKKKDQGQCAACKRLGKPHMHTRNNKQCAAYKMAVERYLNTISTE
ncbi:uncharacterized protein LOC111613288 [Centruroides sculpturatus]|uniref:uncharacterized protein LOC111613288 n=1 Tax=Centruroides sculpturatus TaxID=218467 RepID=UPI000C6E3D01|nr:uncharacterized protein LOC111613288 [Centruroides sculpturatus]